MGSGLVIGTTNWVLVGKTVLAAPALSITVDGIPAGYSILFVISNINLSANTEHPEIQFNDDGGANYMVTDTEISIGLGQVICVNLGATSIASPEAGDGDAAICEMWINQKGTRNFSILGGNATKQKWITGYWAPALEISKLKFFTTANTMAAGSFLAVYGVI